jgi:hypothetical protein
MPSSKDNKRKVPEQIASLLPTSLATAFALPFTANTQRGKCNNERRRQWTVGNWHDHRHGRALSSRVILTAFHSDSQEELRRRYEQQKQYYSALEKKQKKALVIYHHRETRRNTSVNLSCCINCASFT